MSTVLRALGSLVALLALSSAAAGPESVYRVEPVGAREGLDSGIVSTVYIDRAGLLWTATGQGLVRFDGYSKQVFSRNPADPTSLSDNIVRAIVEDRSGRFWVGTNSGGLNLLDRAAGTFTRFVHDADDPDSISGDTVQALLEDRQGALWVGTGNGLNKLLDATTGSFERVLNDSVNAIYEDHSGALWIGANGGLVRRDPATGELTRFSHDPDDARTIDSDMVFAIAEDAEGALWVGTVSGLNRLDRERQTFRRFSDEFASLGGPMMVSALAAEPAGVVWIGTFDAGLLVFDGELRAVRDERDGSGAAPRVITLHATPQAVYVSTWGGGLRRVRFDTVPVVTIRPATESNAAKDVTAILVDPGGTVWLAIYGGPIYRRDPGEDEFRALDANRHNNYAIAGGEREALWYGGETGLRRFDRRTGEVSRFEHDPDDPESPGAGFVTCLLEDSEGRLWVGTSEGGLQRLHEDGRSFETFEVSGNYVTVLYEDGAGTLWVGSGSGLDACDRGTMQCERYASDPSDPRSLEFPGVSAILEDRAGKLWVGLTAGGVNRLDDDGFRRFGAADGLPDDGIRGIVEDDDGSLWVSSRRGLTRFDSATGRAMSLGRADGLPTVDFYHGAAARGRDRLYFGTPEGLVSLPAGTAFSEAQPSPAVFTAIRSPRGPLTLDEPVSSLESLRVPYGEMLSFEFAVLDFDVAQRHRYAYRLGDASADWIDMEGRRDITFTDLRPGSTTLSIRGRNARDVWSESSISLVVVPPFWMTWWFRLGTIAAVVLVALATYRIRVSRLERRNAELQRLHGELHSLTRRLESAREDERKRIARELHDEMGQLLSAAKINLQTLGGLPEETQAKQVDGTVELVDQLLTHVRALSLDLSPPFLDEVGLGPALQGYLAALGERSGIEIDVEIEPELGEFGREMTIHAFRLVQEATTNVIRHADVGRADIRIRRGQRSLEASIKDDGRGFDVEEVLARSKRGLHLGLLGMRERAKSLGGELTIDSRPGAGTEIRFRLPLGP